MSEIRLYVDEDASETKVILGLRARGIDLVTTVEAGRLGVSDQEQLEFAIHGRRVLYTFNAKDFARLHREFLANGRSHSGIFVIPEQRYSVGEKIRRIATFLHAGTAESMTDQIAFL